ncbi:zinc finger protein 23-like isoform X2 [Zootermopsis nevadensis]|uniref:zinc finger protein 23-like isoform X2 n=1 Tax=Zootermopsis nevadensis TaxID=136037 RepID=UPI000B8E6661|nr:zinc finger protein 23-like isoform X2 [Zootermopsis nevadensis]XP_021924189.1 zinc finger protein 23-like isoform X2 [Zootermopsis nevadensis]XP_021924190.1 zinc finger protein 23-like isoform X2 [Zootermopsis nevadensis]
MCVKCLVNRRSVWRLRAAQSADTEIQQRKNSEDESKYNDITASDNQDVDKSSSNNNKDRSKRKGNPRKKSQNAKPQVNVAESNKTSTSTSGKQYEIKTKDARRRRRYVHPCRLCGRLFRRPCEVKQHLLSHGGAKPYQCRDCGKRFGSKSGAGIHALKQHGKDVSVENIIEVCHIPLETVAVSLTPATLKEVASHVKGNSDKAEGDPDGSQSDSSSSSDDDFEWKMDEDVFDMRNEEKEDKERDTDSEDALLSTKVEKEDSNGNVTKEEQSSENDVMKEESNDHVPFVKVEPKSSRSKPVKRKTESGERKRNSRGGAKEKKPKKRDPFPKPPKHECTICGKMWRTMSEFKSHVATHSDERPFICEICGQAYKHKAALDIHVGMHNGINPFSCPFCNKAFTQKGALQRHLPIHTGEAPFQCELCGKRFVHHTSFNMHTLAHTGQKSYKCKVCGLALLSGSHLKRHSRVHTGERPYQCQTCGKRFAERYNLVAHNRIHDPLGANAREGSFKKIHRCQLCGAGFDRKPKLEDHLALSHNKISDSDDSRKWVGHLISNELNQQAPSSSNVSLGTGQLSLHQPNPPLPTDISRRRGVNDGHLLLQSHLHGSENDSKTLSNTTSPHHHTLTTLRAETNQHQQSWHHMIFGGKVMDSDMIESSGMESNVAKMVPISAVLENQHRILSDMTTLGGGLGPGQSVGRNLLPSCLTGGHSSLPPPVSQPPHHIPNVPNPHSSLTPRVNMFPSDNN